MKNKVKKINHKQRKLDFSKKFLNLDLQLPDNTSMPILVHVSLKGKVLQGEKGKWLTGEIVTKKKRGQDNIFNMSSVMFEQ